MVRQGGTIARACQVRYMLLLRLKVATSLIAAATVCESASAFPPTAEAGLETAPRAIEEGGWAVTDTFEPNPDAEAQLSTGLVVARRMVGSFLEATLHRAGETNPLWIDHLCYDAVAGQWRCFSLAARISVASKPAASFTCDVPEHITLRFDPFAAPAIGSGWSGRMPLMEKAIDRDGPDHETKDQSVIPADESDVRWLAHRYDYRRKR